MALLTLDDAKAQLNITTTSNDVELQAYVDAVGPVIEGFIGPVDPREVVEMHRDPGVVLVLRTTPVISVTEIVGLGPSGRSVDAGGLVVDGDTGEVWQASGARWWGPLRATYQAGRSEVPPTVNLAARMLVQHLWRTQTAARGPVIAGGDDYSVSEVIPGLGYAVPNRVLELLEPWRLPPGVA
jgi:hypothetical protein